MPPQSEQNYLQIFTTVRDWVRFAMTEFQKANLYYGHGTDNAMDEAVYLILDSLHLPLDLPSHLFDSKLTFEERKNIDQIIQKRIKTRKPSAYLTQESFFMGLSFFVDKRVLIPRSPLAELIEKQFYPWISHQHQVNHILDLCTGSGCIGIACAHIFPKARITATDISPEALEVAQININHYDLNPQIALIQSDGFENLPPQKFDIIISNPPYVDKADMDSLPPEYHHEPRLALAGGRDGLDFIRKILTHAEKYLSPEGILVVETGNSKSALIKEFPDIPFVWLTFEQGEGEVFILTYQELAKSTAASSKLSYI